MRAPRFARKRAPGAVLRAALTGAAALAPSLILADGAATPGGVVMAAAAALIVLAEYGAKTPALLDFRFAPPVNRLRFALVCAALGAVTATLALDGGGGGAAGQAVRAAAGAISAALDFPASPARLAAEAVARPSAPGPEAGAQAAAAVALAVAAPGAVVGALVLWFGRWPGPPERFDPMTNLPVFEPATGPDAPQRLRRLGRLVILTALATPLALLVLARFAVAILDPELFRAPMVLAWSATLWAGLPAAMIVRGAAILKLARVLADDRDGAEAARP